MKYRENDHKVIDLIIHSLSLICSITVELLLNDIVNYIVQNIISIPISLDTNQQKQYINLYSQILSSFPLYSLHDELKIKTIDFVHNFLTHSLIKCKYQISNMHFFSHILPWYRPWTPPLQLVLFEIPQNFKCSSRSNCIRYRK